MNNHLVALKGRCKKLSGKHATNNLPPIETHTTFVLSTIDQMSQSLVKNNLHIVFSTKHRQASIIPSIEHELHSYLGGICSELECQPIKIGGYYDHVHILCSLSKKIALMSFMEKLKGHSSRWIKTKGPIFNDFYWQDGYGAFSVDSKDVDRLIKYIENQHDHHKKITFKKEFISLLKRYKISYDERYLWD